MVFHLKRWVDGWVSSSQPIKAAVKVGTHHVIGAVLVMGRPGFVLLFLSQLFLLIVNVQLLQQRLPNLHVLQPHLLNH